MVLEVGEVERQIGVEIDVESVLDGVRRVQRLQEAIRASVADVFLHRSCHTDVEVTEADTIRGEVLLPVEKGPDLGRDEDVEVEAVPHVTKCLGAGAEGVADFE